MSCQPRYTFITTTEKPVEIRVREAVKPLADMAQDPNLSDAERRAAATSVMLRHAQIMAESECGNRPAVLGRRRRW